MEGVGGAWIRVEEGGGGRRNSFVRSSGTALRASDLFLLSDTVPSCTESVCDSHREQIPFPSIV